MVTSSLPVLPSARTLVLRRRVRLIVALTIAYNLVEAVVAITAGTVASSSALVGFGLDSTVEVVSAAVIAWQFAHHDPADRERTALRLVAASFFALALYVSVEAVLSLAGSDTADHSTVGIVLAAASLLVMPFLSMAERRTGRELGSASVVADSKQTLLCSYLSAVLLLGLLANSTLDWSWADPVAALVIAAVAVREGVSAWRGGACCVPASALLDGGEAETAGCGCADGCSGSCCSPAADDVQGVRTTSGAAPWA